MPRKGKKSYTGSPWADGPLNSNSLYQMPFMNVPMGPINMSSMGTAMNPMGTAVNPMVNPYLQSAFYWNNSADMFSEYANTQNSYSTNWRHSSRSSKSNQGSPRGVSRGSFRGSPRGASQGSSRGSHRGNASGLHQGNASGLHQGKARGSHQGKARGSHRGNARGTQQGNASTRVDEGQDTKRPRYKKKKNQAYNPEQPTSTADEDIQEVAVTTNNNKSQTFGAKAPSQDQKGSKKNRARYCTVCEINIDDGFLVHRRSKEHRKQRDKKFPRCRLCAGIFSSPEEYDEHKKSEEHIKKSEDFKALRDQQLVHAALSDSEDDASALTRYVDNQPKDQNTTSETGDAIGTRHVIPLKAFFCKLCQKLFKGYVMGRHIHCKTPAHIQKYKTYFDEKEARATERNRLKQEEKRQKKAEDDVCQVIDANQEDEVMQEDVEEVVENEVIGDEVIEGEVIGDEVIEDEVIADDVIEDEVIGDEVIEDEDEILEDQDIEEIVEEKDDNVIVEVEDSSSEDAGAEEGEKEEWGDKQESAPCDRQQD